MNLIILSNLLIPLYLQNADESGNEDNILQYVTSTTEAEIEPAKEIPACLLSASLIGEASKEVETVEFECAPNDARARHQFNYWANQYAERLCRSGSDLRASARADARKKQEEFECPTDHCSQKILGSVRDLSCDSNYCVSNVEAFGACSLNYEVNGSRVGTYYRAKVKVEGNALATGLVTCED